MMKKTQPNLVSQSKKKFKKIAKSQQIQVKGGQEPMFDEEEGYELATY